MGCTHFVTIYGARNGVFLEMLYHEVFKTEPSFSKLESFGLRRYFVFKDISNHVFDQSKSCFKPVTIVTLSLIKTVS